MVKQEIVTITKNGKQVVKVTIEPATAPPVRVKVDGFVAKMLDARLKAVYPQGDPDRINLVRMAWQDAQPDAPVRNLDGPVPQTHPVYSDLRRLAVEGGKDDLAPDRVRDVIESSYHVAGKILQDTATSIALNQGRMVPADSGQKGGTPVLRRDNGIAARAHDHKAGEVLVLATQAVGNPRAHTGARQASVAAIHEQQARLVIGHLGLHRADDRHVVDVSRGLGEQFTNLDAGFAIPGKLER